MKYVKLLDKEKNIYTTGEDISFILRIHSDKKLDNVFLGITNMYLDGTRIGGTETNVFNLDNGFKELLVSLPTDVIPDGIYTLELTLNQRIEGMNTRLDSVKQAIPYSIVNNDGAAGTNWAHNIYGHTMYKTATVQII